MFVNAVALKERIVAKPIVILIENRLENKNRQRMRPLSQLCLIIILLVLLFQSCKQGHPVDKKEAVNSIKILNSDIISFIYRTSGRPEMKALGFLLKQPSAPIPFHYDSSGGLANIKTFSFEANRGVYRWDTLAKSFIKTKDTSLILIFFPIPGDPASECRFILYNYVIGKTRTKPVFPVKLNASLFIGDKEEITIRHEAVINESMIASMETELKNDSAGLSFYMSRTGSFAAKTGEIKASLRLHEGKSDIMNSTLKCEIEYHAPISYSFSHMSIEQTLFSTELSGTIDYASINPSSDQYNQEFNKYTHLELLNSEDHGIIGKIVLSPVGEDGRYDYFIRFSDGSESRLTEQFIVLNKLFNKIN